MPGNEIVGVAYDLKAAFDLTAAFLRSGLTAEVYRGGAYRAESVAQAAVYDTESFFMRPEEEYALLAGLFRAAPEKAYCFLKSDSSLRGNVGAELAALMDARGLRRLAFVPALPGARKFTRNGVQYQLTGDADESVVLADAAGLIRGFRETTVSCGPAEGFRDAPNGVYILDCASTADFEAAVEALTAENGGASAGTGALAGRLSTICDLKVGNPVPAGEAAVRLDGKAGLLNLNTLEWKEAE